MEPKKVVASEVFEQKIHRLYDLLTETGAEVKWNDHIPDPDNPGQIRQIDVTVRQGGALTLIECRYHKTRQDVQWIEELMGRKMSLGASAVIAVSSSGFTKGAIAKARKYGVTLRDLERLTDREIESWGRRIALTLYFYEYSDLNVSLILSPESIGRIKPEAAKSELRTHPCVQSLFNAAARKLGELNLLADEQPGRTVKFGLRIQFDGFLLCGERINEVIFKGQARLVALKVAPSIVYAYGEPKEQPATRETIIQDFATLGETSITHSGSRVYTLLDLSQLEVPPFWQFRFWNQDSGQQTDHAAVEILLGNRFEQLKVTGEGLRVKLCTSASLEEET